MSEVCKCGLCGATDCRLYRPYGNFYRPADNRCNGHIDEKDRGWYVPLCTSDDGTIWGYTSVPPEAVRTFFAKTDKYPSNPTWEQGGWSNRNDRVA